MSDVGEGGCRCELIGFALSHAFGPVVSCHCSFCRRVHGAAFTTVGFVPRSAVAWLRGEERVATYLTPQGNRRHFCPICASPLFNVGGGGSIAAIVISSLPDQAQPAPWAHVNVESKAPWHVIADDLPIFSSWPPGNALRALAREHEQAWVPEQLLLPDP